MPQRLPLVATVVLAFAVTAAHAETQFPYELSIGPGGIDARSGPGAHFYATDHLPAGSKVEVYRHEEGGWLAIRPPASSVSWVRRNDLRPTNQPGVAEVIHEDAICCIGSNVEQVRDHLSYVSLHRGELVQLLDNALRKPPASLGKNWQAIAPPAGEFRWVPGGEPKGTRAVSATETPIRIPSPDPAAQLTSQASETPQMPAGVASRPAAGASPAVAPSAPEATGGGWEAKGSGSAGSLRVPQDGLPAHLSSGSLAQPTTGPPGTTPVSEQVPAASPKDSNGRGQKDTSMPLRPIPVLSDASETEAETPREVATDAVSQRAEQAVEGRPQWASRRPPLPGELSRLEAELTLMVARPMSAWRLLPLHEQTQAIIDKLPDGTQRVYAEGLLERIVMFEQLQNRYAQTAAMRETDPGTAPAAGGVNTRHSSIIAAAREHYDAVGWLMPVYASSPIAPPYALLDAQGDVLQYVTPAPGLNLYRYVKQKVGIYGQRSYMPSLNKPHVVAERVINLDRHFR